MRTNSIYIFILFIAKLLFVESFSFAQGSGNCLLFNGTNNYVEIPDNPLFSSHKNGVFSVEAWVNVQAINTDGHYQSRQPIVMKGNSGQWEWALYVYDDLSVGFSSWQCSGSSHSEPSGGSIVLGQWHHIAASFSDYNYNRVYIDGVLVVEGTSFSGSACDGSRPVRIASREDGQFLNAYVDEVRIWNKALSQTEIRQNMCKKLTGTEANLIAYYRIDEGANKVCSASEDVCDLSPNGFNGVNNNSPVWGYSGAPIGDESTYLYTNSWGGQTINLNSTNKGNFELSIVTNNPDGIHVYRVDGYPNSSVGIPQTLGSNNVYYGTFVARAPFGGDFSVKYDYTNYPDAIAEENNLVLYARVDNSDMSWADNGATLNTVANTLTSNGETVRKEYTIASTSGALPIELLYFKVDADEENKIVTIEWWTASEKDNATFIIERSKDAELWQEVSEVSGAINSNETIKYSYIDKNPLLGYSYYRIKQIDLDGNFSFSPIKNVYIPYENNYVIYPNPANSSITIEGQNIFSNYQIYNNVGVDVTSMTQLTSFEETLSVDIINLDISNLDNGLYFIAVAGKMIKFIKG